METGDGEPDDSGSTLVQTGKAALRLNEMAAFVHDIEARPLPRLLSDLDGLMALPDAKFELVVMVLRRKVSADPAEGRATAWPGSRSCRAPPSRRSRWLSGLGRFLAKPHE